MPRELFSNIIGIKQNETQNIVSVLSVVPALLSELRENPACEFSISSQGDIFETRIKYGAKSYIARLSGEQTADSSRIKSRDTTHNYAVVWGDRIGVTKVEFIHSEVFNSGSKAICKKGGNKRNIRADCRNCLLNGCNAKNSLDTLSKREWVCAVAITGEQLFVKSKVGRYQ